MLEVADGHEDYKDGSEYGYVDEEERGVIPEHDTCIAQEDIRQGNLASIHPNHNNHGQPEEQKYDS